MTRKMKSLTVPFLRTSIEETVVELNIADAGDLFLIRLKGVPLNSCGDPIFSYCMPVPSYMMKDLRDGLADLLYRDKSLSWSSPDPTIVMEIPVQSRMSDTFEPLIRMIVSSPRTSMIRFVSPELVSDKSLKPNLRGGIDVFISGYETSRESLDQIREFLSARLLYS